MRIRRKPVEVEPMPEREAELCEKFAEAAREQGWIVYPETAGWDLVLVWGREGTEGLATGDQLGIEAKLRPSVEVLAQAHGRGTWQGPDFRGVLVPDASPTFTYIASCLNLHTFDLRSCLDFVPKHGHDRYGRWRRRRLGLSVDQNRRWKPDRRLWLPPVPLAGAGGAPSPRQLSKWRVGALRLCLLLRSRGYLTAEDFRREKISPSRWPACGWLVADGKIGRLTRYIAGPKPLPDVGYEVERDALASLTLVPV